MEKWGRIGLALTVVGCVLHGLGLVSRGLGSDPIRVPWGNMYEFTLAGTFGVSVMYLVLMKRYHLRWMGVLVTAFLVVVLMLDVLVLYQDAGPLVPALHSYWLAIHVLAAVIASGAFAVGALALVLFLAKDRADRRGTIRPGGYLSRLPETSALERVAYRLHAFGFPIWTFAALVAGPIWAEYAWGSYWNWDPKEVWAFITWVIYAAYLHARATAGWKGKAAVDHRADRVRVAAVQLRRDQLLLRRWEHALLRRQLTRPGRLLARRRAAARSACPGPAGGCGGSGPAGSPRRRRGRRCGGSGAAGAPYDGGRRRLHHGGARAARTRCRRGPRTRSRRAGTYPRPQGRHLPKPCALMSAD